MHSPLLIEDRRADLQASEQGYGDECLNFGFFMAQPRQRVVGLFERLVAWTQRRDVSKCWDQAVFDFAIRGASNILAMRAECAGDNVSVLATELRPDGSQIRWKTILSL